MSAPRDLDRLLRSFLKEGPLELPDPSYDEVRDRMEHTRQRAFIGPWRTPVMNRYLQIGVAAAAVVLVAIIGFQYLGSNVGGPNSTATPEPTPTPEPSGAAPSSSAAELPLGSSHVLWNAPGDIQISVTIPSSGWFGDVGAGFITKDDNPDPPAGAGIVVFQGPLYVYGDRCHWATTRPETPATTVDEILRALMAQTPDDGGSPLNVSLGGYSGAVLKLHVPDGALFADCDRGEFRSWVGDPVADNARYHQGPGQDDYAWVIDVNGTPVVLDVGNFYETPSATRDEMDAIVHSVVFELP
jgi:hypothetical protein